MIEGAFGRTGPPGHAVEVTELLCKQICTNHKLPRLTCGSKFRERTGINFLIKVSTGGQQDQ